MSNQPKQFKLPPLTLRLRSSSPQVEKDYKQFALKMKGVYPTAIPKNFDGRLVWGLNPPRNQGLNFMVLVGIKVLASPFHRNGQHCQTAGTPLRGRFS